LAQGPTQDGLFIAGLCENRALFMAAR